MFNKRKPGFDKEPLLFSGLLFSGYCRCGPFKNVTIRVKHGCHCHNGFEHWENHREKLQTRLNLPVKLDTRHFGQLNLSVSKKQKSYQT